MKLRNILFLVAGFISMGIGLLGVALPVLPTTPFILISSFCFVRGSDRFNAWFTNTKIYKDYAEDFVKDRSMTLQRKIRILLLSDVMIAFPLFILESIYIKLGLILIIIIKYYYFIFKIKTKK